MADNLQLGAALMVAFPALNKNNDIAYNQAQIKESACLNQCVIRKVIEVAPAEFDQIANAFLDDRNDLWEGIGGAELPPEAQANFNALAAEFGIDPDSPNAIYANDQLLNFVRANCVVPVVALVADGRPAQFINSEGYSYARYVGEAYGGPIGGCLDCGAPADRVVGGPNGPVLLCAKHAHAFEDKLALERNKAANRVDVVEGSRFEAGLDGPALARKLKAALQREIPGSKWKASGRIPGAWGRAQAKLIALPPGMKVSAAEGEPSYGEAAEHYVSPGKWGWSAAFGALMDQAEAIGSSFNRCERNSHLPGLDRQAYDIRVEVDFWAIDKAREALAAAA